MIRHYIKTAFRNLLKYKAQNIILSYPDIGRHIYKLINVLLL